MGHMSQRKTYNSEIVRGQKRAKRKKMLKKEMPFGFKLLA